MDHTTILFSSNSNTLSLRLHTFKYLHCVDKNAAQEAVNVHYLAMPREVVMV